MAEEEDYIEYKVTMVIWKFCPPVLLLTGTLGHLMTVAVLNNRRARTTSTSAFLTALAGFDLLALYTGLIRQWIKYTFDVDIRELSEVGCKFHVFLVYACLQASSWILVAITLERVACVLCPIKAKRVFTVKFAAIIICVTVTCLMLLNLHWFIGFGIFVEMGDNVTYTELCTSLSTGYDHFYMLSWPWIDMCVVFLVPFIIILTGNSYIIIQLALNARRRLTRIAPHPSVRNKINNNANTITNQNTEIACSNITTANQNEASARSNETTSNRNAEAAHSNDTTSNPNTGEKTSNQITEDKHSQLRVILFSLSIVFFVCVLPSTVYQFAWNEWYKIDCTTKEDVIWAMWWAIVNILMYTNNAINFVLYFMSSPRFRHDTKTYFRGLRKWIHS